MNMIISMPTIKTVIKCYHQIMVFEQKLYVLGLSFTITAGTIMIFKYDNMLRIYIK